MKTPTIDQIYKHASIRRYKLDPIPREMIEAIVAAGQRASTSSNLQAYSAVAVNDAKTRTRLAELCGNQAHIQQAPVFIAWCADISRLERISLMRDYQQVSEYVENFLIAAIDVALVMQNAALAAESLGLGMCYIGAIRNHPEEVIKLLELPKLVFPLVGMTLGWPNVDAKQRPRLPTRTILHWEKYNLETEKEALQEYDRSMVESSIYRGRQVSVPGVEGEKEFYGWMEHSARRASKPARTVLREVLKNQGFKLK
jgi:FMN reductase (NADPH)